MSAQTYDPTTWRSSRVDLIIATAVALVFPPIAGWLYGVKGALIPIALYYSLAWGLSKLRRGLTGYGTPLPEKPPVWFYANVVVILFALSFAHMAPIKVETPDMLGVLLTALLWAPANASSEQLLWLYIFDSWDLYPEKPKLSYRLIGLLLFSAYVGAIHTLFWTKFLHIADPESFFGVIFVLLTTISGYLHIIVWRKSGQMVFTFIPHLLLNIGPLLWTGYSILPYLWR